MTIPPLTENTASQTPELTLETLGWTPELAALFAPHRAREREPGRVVVEDKHHYVVFTRHGVLTGRASGKFLHTAKNPAELPKVGDWISLTPYPKEGKALIHEVLPRQTQLSRKLPGRETAEQILVTNVDTAFVVMALDRTFNPRLIERFLLMVVEGGIKPVVLLNKTDLCEDLEKLLDEAGRAAGATPVLAVSAKTGKGLKQLSGLVKPQQAVVFIGASGVGKSSLINRLYGEEVAATTEVRETDQKGRHTTTWRELIVLPKGGLVIDTPGMREFQLWMAGESVHEAFPDIMLLGTGCRFRNCQHQAEAHCAVKLAVAAGQLSQERYDNFLKLRRETEFLEKAGHLSRRRPYERPRDHLAAHEDE